MTDASDRHAAGRCAIVVVARERVSTVRTCLEHLYAYTEPPFRVLVVDVGASRALSAELVALAARLPGCEVLASGGPVMPYDAYNLALARLAPEDRWVALVDNDVKVGPGWLSWLLRAAAESGARAVHPLYLVEQLGRTVIHMARGRYDATGAGRVRPVMELCGADLSRAAGLARADSGFFELHTALLRRDLVDELGPFAPVSLAADHEICLRLRARGERVVFEPRAVVTYAADPVPLPEDRRFFRFRWRLSLAVRSIERLRAQTPIVDEYWDEKLAWVKRHRRLGARWFKPAVRAKRLLERVARAPLALARAPRRSSRGDSRR